MVDTVCWKRFYVNGVMLTLLTAVLHARFYPYAEDDAYIHFRIARNLLEYGYPYFNLEEPLNVSTSLLWDFILCPILPFGFGAIAGLNAFITVISVFVWVTLTNVLFRFESFVERAIVGLSVWCSLLLSSLALMETPLAFLCLGGAWLLVENRKVAWSFCAALAILLRPEMILFSVIVLIRRVLQRERLRALEVLGGLTPLILYVIVAWHYFGTIVPHTIAVKHQVYRIPIDLFPRLAMYAAFGKWVGDWLIPPVVIISFFLAILLILRAKRPTFNLIHPSRWPIATFFVLPPIVVLGTYALSGVPVFVWYAPLFTLTLSIVAATTVTRGIVPSRVLSGLILAPLFSVGLLCLVGVVHLSWYPLFESGARVRQYLHVGSMLEASFPHARILTSEIGGLGFSFGGTIVDGVGLATKEALQFHPLKVPEQRPAEYLGAIPAGLVELTHPDLIVSLPAFLRDCKRAGVLDRYHRITVPPVIEKDHLEFGIDHVWGNHELEIYIDPNLGNLPNFGN